MNKIISVLILVALAAVGYYLVTSSTAEAPVVIDDAAESMTNAQPGLPSIKPISHATFVLNWGGTIIYNDPIGGAEAFAGQPAANMILVSDVHGDHLSIETLEAVAGEETLIIAPPAVAEQFPESLMAQTQILKNGEVGTFFDVRVSAIPMYNLPDQGVEIRHEAGRGNGYVLQRGDKRVYIAGDTADIPEMRQMTDIDMAFVPMNLPYTMSVEDAADAVIEFAPAQVYPYHYRTPEGFSDVTRFEELVNAGNPAVEVVQLDWYSSQATDEE